MLTGPHKQLGEIIDAEVARYEPSHIQTCIESQEIVIYPPPLFVFSPNQPVYVAKDIRRFKGYLSKFEPVNQGEGEEPQMSITIEVLKQCSSALKS